jgi:hypothetical protein
MAVIGRPVPPGDPVSPWSARAAMRVAAPVLIWLAVVAALIVLVRFGILAAWG